MVCRVFNKWYYSSPSLVCLKQRWNSLRINAPQSALIQKFKTMKNASAMMNKNHSECYWISAIAFIKKSKKLACVSGVSIDITEAKVEVRNWNELTLGGFLRAVNPHITCKKSLKRHFEFHRFSLFQDPTTNFPSDCNLDTNDVVYCRK